MKITAEQLLFATELIAARIEIYMEEGKALNAQTQNLKVTTQGVGVAERNTRDLEIANYKMLAMLELANDLKALSDQAVKDL